MKKYIGIKVVTAEPMTKEDAVRSGLINSAGIDKSNESDGYCVIYQDGYKSWSPKSVFEKAYRECMASFGFSLAIDLLKGGHRVTREGWNGKGMYIFLIGANMCACDGIGGWTYTNGVNDNYENLPFIAMKTADDKIVPWLASQSDMLANDWTIELGV